MAAREQSQELVVLFDDSVSTIDLEMRFGQFNGLLEQKGTLPSHSGRTVRAAYVQVGEGLSVRAVVFFRIKFTEQGYMDPAFNLPLEYMASNAGAGPDLGRGAISMACRSQCPVPWHGINMWEPAGEGDSHPAMLVQKAVWRNRLGLKVTALRPAAAPSERKPDEALESVVETVANLQQAMSTHRSRSARESDVQTSVAARAAGGSAVSQAGTAAKARSTAPKAKAKAEKATSHRSVSRSPRRRPSATAESSRTSHSPPQPSAPAPLPPPPPGPAVDPEPDAMRRKPNGIARMRAMEEKLTATFGEAGRMSVSDYTRQHREQMGEAAAQFRAEMERQQKGYLDQIKSCRQEIQELKAALRHEQKRNQRLQDLLRGDVF